MRSEQMYVATPVTSKSLHYASIANQSNWMDGHTHTHSQLATMPFTEPPRYTCLMQDRWWTSLQLLQTCGSIVCIHDECSHLASYFSDCVCVCVGLCASACLLQWTQWLLQTTPHPYWIEDVLTTIYTISGSLFSPINTSIHPGIHPSIHPSFLAFIHPSIHRFLWSETHLVGSYGVHSAHCTNNLIVYADSYWGEFAWCSNSKQSLKAAFTSVSK